MGGQEKKTNPGSSNVRPGSADTDAKSHTNAVARNSVKNVLKPGFVFVIVRHPVVSDDVFHLVPARDSKKKEPKTEKIAISSDSTAIHFINPVNAKGFAYDLVQGRASGRELDLVVAELQSTTLSKYRKEPPISTPPRKHVPWRPPRHADIEQADEILGEYITPRAHIGPAAVGE